MDLSQSILWPLFGRRNNATSLFLMGFCVAAGETIRIVGENGATAADAARCGNVDGCRNRTSMTCKGFQIRCGSCGTPSPDNPCVIPGATVIECHPDATNAFVKAEIARGRGAYF